MTRAPWELTRDMFLSPDEARRLLAHVRRAEAAARDDPDAWRAARVDRLIIEGLLFSGLRCSEFCRLRVDDTVVGRRRSVFVVGERQEQREVIVPAGLSDLVRDFVEHVRPALLSQEFDARDSEVPLIIGDRGRPYDRTALYRRVVRILAEAGFEQRASVQLLRHTYGHLAYLATAGNLLFVQRQLGHAHPMITAIYAQFVEEDYGSLAERVAAAADCPSPAESAEADSVRVRGRRPRPASSARTRKRSRA
jgi:integrase